MHTLPETLRWALLGSLPGLDAQLRMAPRPRAGVEPRVALEDLRPAAALLLVYPHESQWHVPLTVRGSSLRHHNSQISLPGGRVDPGESPEEAALREAYEEIGVLPPAVEVLGRLTPLPIVVSGHVLHPVVGLTTERPAFRVAPSEVDRLIEVPVERLRHPDVVRWEERLRTRPPHGVMDVPYFDIEDTHVWGATAMVLAEFLALLGERQA
ncbi:MAG: NUDIX hydrolase [Vicinamibacterales bacterium]